jgi:hypothetical protein
MRSFHGALVGAVALAFGAFSQPAAGQEKLAGQLAPPLMATDWLGQPFDVKDAEGNTLVVLFWSADIAC